MARVERPRCRCVSTAIRSIALLTSLACPESVRGAGQVVTYLPGAVETPGANGTFFSSTAYLTNLGADPISVFPGVISSPGIVPPPVAVRVIAPGETQVVPHVLAAWFGSVYKAGTLTLTSSPMLLARLETANTVDPSATYGVGLDPVSEGQALVAGQTAHSAWVSVSADPNAGYRTNVAVTLLDPNSSVAIEVRDDQGNLRGSTSISSPVPEWVQLSVADLIGSVGLPLGRAALKVTTGRAIGMTVVNDNVTGDAIASRFERVVTGPSDVLLDGVARSPGLRGTHWSTDLRILNPGTAAVAVVLETVGFSPAPASIARTVLPGGLIEIEDVLGAAGFGLPDGVAGALHIHSDGAVLASARTKSTNLSGLRPGTFSGFQAAVPWTTGFVSPPYVGFFIGLDQTTAVPGTRTNLALLGGTSSARASLVLRDAAGSRLASSSITLAPGEWRQMGLDGWFPTIQISAGARVDLVVNSGSAHGYVSRIDNGSGDPVVLPVAVPPGDIDRSFFGLTVNKQTSPWPTFSPFGAYRTLGSAIKWADLETCDGGSDPQNPCYRWDAFDSWLAKAGGGGADVLFTLYATPTWASSRGSRCTAKGSPDAGCTGLADTGCAFQAQNGPGICDPPDDIDAVPGTGKADGTNRHFRDFVTALLAHARPGTIRFWEIWNEPNISTEWNNSAGTYAQLVRMARDAREIVSAADPDALFTTPAVANTSTAAANWLEPYLRAGGGDVADIIAFHGYVGPSPCPGSCPVAENELTAVAALKTVISRNGQQGKRVFDTEVSWGEKSNVTDWGFRSAFTGRMYLLSMSAAVDRLYWYGLDFAISTTGGSGELWAPPGNPDGCIVPNNGGFVCPAGVAVTEIYRWTVGASFDVPCAASGTTWTCALIRPNGYRAVAVWDTGAATASWPVPAGATQLRRLDGTASAIPAGSPSVSVGASPILVEIPGR